MPKDKKRLIAILIITAIILVVTVGMVIRSLTANSKLSQVGSRYPIAALAYCSMDPSHLCVASFGQIVNGPMQVDLLAPSADYPAFVLKISNNGTESLYECRTVEEAPENIHCTGNVQPPGSTLQLMLFTAGDNSLIAKGTFSLVGVALLTPEVVIDDSGHRLSPQLGFRIPDAPKRGPLSTHLTPSYPNPSYP